MKTSSKKKRTCISRKGMHAMSSLPVKENERFQEHILENSILESTLEFASGLTTHTRDFFIQQYILAKANQVVSLIA